MLRVNTRYRLQVDKKQYSVHIKKVENLLGCPMLIVNIWRNRSLRCGTSFTMLSTNEEIKNWAKTYIKQGKGRYFTR